MTDMIERVARALFAAHNADPDWGDGYETAGQAANCGDDTELSHEECFALARAAIAAMREPTEAMVKAGLVFPQEPQDREFDPVISNDLPIERYKDMIDAALADPPSDPRH